MQSMIDQADDDLLWHESMKMRVGCTEMPSIQIQSKEMRIRLKTSKLQVSAHGYPLSQRAGRGESWLSIGNLERNVNN